MTQHGINFIDISSLNKQMVEIPSGVVELRDDRTKQKWPVDIDSFVLSKFPVTQSFYFSVTNENPSTLEGHLHPVETVTWKEAIVFCNHLSVRAGLATCYILKDENDEIMLDSTANGFRLPTEAEWEYACKAGTDSIRYGKLNDVAWFKDNSNGTTHMVGQKEPNPWGLYDMLGNVWEWCSDIYDETIYGSYRIFRGGG